jgi:hypothetical protein
VKDEHCHKKIKELLGTNDEQLVEEFKLQIKFLKKNGCLDDNMCKSLAELAAEYEKNGVASIDYAEISLLSDCSCLTDYEDKLDDERDDA